MTNEWSRWFTSARTWFAFRLRAAASDHVVVQLDVQGVQLGPALFVPEGEHDFERLLGIIVSVARASTPADAQPIEVALAIEAGLGEDAYLLSVSIGGDEIGVARMTLEELGEFERFVEQSILLVSARSPHLACA